MTDQTVHRTAVVISGHISLLEGLVEEGGFSVVGATETAVNGERLAGMLRPDVIVIEHDLPGQPGHEAIPGLRTTVPDARIVLVVNEHRSRSDISHLGACAVVGTDELPTLADRLHDLDEVIDLRGDDGVHVERRSGHDRRQVQDWSKVGWERRRTVRRAADRERIAAAQPAVGTEVDPIR